MAAERVAQICGPLWGGEVLHNYYLVFLFPAIFLILSISLMLSSWSWMDDSKFKKGKTMIFFSFSTMLEFLHQFYAKFRVPITSTLSKPEWGLKHRYSRIAIVVPFCHFSPLKWPFGAIFDSKRTENANFSGSDAPRLISVVRVRERIPWLIVSRCSRPRSDPLFTQRVECFVYFGSNKLFKLFILPLILQEAVR